MGLLGGPLQQDICVSPKRARSLHTLRHASWKNRLFARVWGGQHIFAVFASAGCTSTSCLSRERCSFIRVSHVRYIYSTCILLFCDTVGWRNLSFDTMQKARRTRKVLDNRGDNAAQRSAAQCIATQHNATQLHRQLRAVLKYMPEYKSCTIRLLACTCLALS